MAFQVTVWDVAGGQVLRVEERVGFEHVAIEVFVVDELRVRAADEPHHILQLDDLLKDLRDAYGLRDVRFVLQVVFVELLE